MAYTLNIEVYKWLYTKFNASKETLKRIKVSCGIYLKQMGSPALSPSSYGSLGKLYSLWAHINFSYENT